MQTTSPHFLLGWRNPEHVKPTFQTFHPTFQHQFNIFILIRSWWHFTNWYLLPSHKPLKPPQAPRLRSMEIRCDYTFYLFNCCLIWSEKFYLFKSKYLIFTFSSSHNYIKLGSYNKKKHIESNIFSLPTLPSLQFWWEKEQKEKNNLNNLEKKNPIILRALAQEVDCSQSCNLNVEHKQLIKNRYLKDKFTGF